eukprot:976194-Rhodomonas_salina.5
MHAFLVRYGRDGGRNEGEEGNGGHQLAAEVQAKIVLVSGRTGTACCKGGSGRREAGKRKEGIGGQPTKLGWRLCCIPDPSCKPVAETIGQGVSWTEGSGQYQHKGRSDDATRNVRVCSSLADAQPPLEELLWFVVVLVLESDLESSLEALARRKFIAKLQLKVSASLVRIPTLLPFLCLQQTPILRTLQELMGKVNHSQEGTCLYLLAASSRISTASSFLLPNMFPNIPPLSFFSAFATRSSAACAGSDMFASP